MKRHIDYNDPQNEEPEESEYDHEDDLVDHGERLIELRQEKENEKF